MFPKSLLSALAVLWVPAIVRAGCKTDKLVVYKVQLETFWDEETFPRQYPEWRPNAQWSKTLGFSHLPSWQLFRMGDVVSGGVREFVETGETEKLDRENNTSNFLDVFTIPPIETGKGKAESIIFLDGNHTRVSVITKIVPSPDWFIGLDNLDLCQNGKFVDTLRIEADPMDAGTDNGFTFTSPNWPTEPQGVVFRITNSYPPHPAGSFHYPNHPKLPNIATFSFYKDKEYELSEEFHPLHAEARTEQVDNSDANKFSYQMIGDNKHETTTKMAEIVAFVPVEETTKRHKKTNDEITTNEIPVFEKRTGKTSRIGLKGSARKTSGFRSSSSLGDLGGLGGYHASTSPKDFFKKKYASPHLSSVDQIVFPAAKNKNTSPKTSRKSELYRQILESYKTKGSLTKELEQKIKKFRKHKMRRFRKRKDSRHSKQKKPKDCRVSSWGPWGKCSKTCGIGEAERIRKVTRDARYGGKPCPALKDFKWCGSARNCKTGYFSW